ncbi:hypothetical protein ACQEVB_01210 [Pseudonocardia sp. CA-107938]|uniref:hypothetical protein n=1 Tax=Pseudonocardia sp. CA-107938 TaxID=3240021 RepID=UPI003D8AF793
MAEHRCTIVRIDPVPPATAAALGTALAGWLQDARIVVVNRAVDPVWEPCAFRPGPRWWTTFAQAGDRFGPEVSATGMDVLVDREAHTPSRNLVPPRCPGCGSAGDEDEYVDHAGRWVAATEPAMTCASCGRAAPLGEWADGRFGIAVGAPAVRFSNWWPLADDFVTEVRSRLGGRTSVVEAKI